MSFNLNRWLSVRIDLLGAIFIAALASYLIYGHSVGAGNTGFSLNQAVEFCAIILWWVRYLNEFEVQGNRWETSHRAVYKITETWSSSAWNASKDTLILNMSRKQLKLESLRLHGLPVAISVWKTFQLGIHRYDFSWNRNQHLMILLRQAQWFFTIFRSTSSLDNALELARLVSVVHIRIVANLAELSWPHREWQGTVLDLGTSSGHPSLI